MGQPLVAIDYYLLDKSFSRKRIIRNCHFRRFMQVT